MHTQLSLYEIKNLFVVDFHVSDRSFYQPKTPFLILDGISAQIHLIKWSYCRSYKRSESRQDSGPARDEGEDTSLSIDGS